jgi:hypothetical protein
MSAPQRAAMSNSTLIDEFVTEATMELLNGELIKRAIAAEQVVAILPMPARIMANPTPERFRVLYRTQ